MHKMNIVLFWFVNDWGKYGRTYEMIAKTLSRRPEVNHVICFFPPNEVKRGQFAAPLKIIRDDKVIIYTENENVLPVNTAPYHIKRKINMIIRNAALKLFMVFLGLNKRNTILWVFPPHPYIERLLTIIPHKMVVSHVVDDFTKIDRKHFLYRYAVSQYPKVQDFSDIVITTSKFTNRFFGSMNDKCYAFENAADEIFISPPSVSQSRLNNASPRLGYLGWITERTDLGLLEYIARKRPNWSLSIAGPQHVKLSQNLLSLPNVEYLGTVPYPAAPEFVRSLDVCLLPHKDTSYSRSMSPLKIFQYLASGRPIVSTPISTVERFRDYIHIGETYEKFLEKIEDALRGDTIEKSMARIEMAKAETWDKRVDAMLGVIKSN